ncbi:MAG: metal-dependent hydrolase [Bryobacteraceae bacterium]
MDNLTHTLTGIMLSRAGLGRWSPRASVLMALAANVPDIDVLWGIPFGTAAYLDVHRGFSHGVATIPLMAALPVALVGLWRRPPNFPWLRAWTLAIVAVASHLLLDLTNIYGIRLGSPFSQTWYRLDWTNVVDPWIWAVLLLGVVWPMLAGLVSSEIGAKSKAGPGIARFALAFLILYEGGRWLLHGRAVETLAARIYAHGTPRRVMAMPSAWSPLRWRGLVETGAAWQVVPIDLTAEFDPAEGQVFYKPDPNPWIERARATGPFQALERFSSTLFWRVTPLPELDGGVEVAAGDIRFGDPGSGAFQATARFRRDGSLVESRFGFGAPPGDRLRVR